VPSSQSQPSLPAAMRREAMLDALQENEFLRVTELGERFGVSEVTVRADLDALVALGAVRRVHGGAMPTTNRRLERPFEDQAGAHADEKAAIAREAAQLVASGDVVALDVGTTTTALAIALRRRDDLERVTVITNGLNIALELERANPRISVIVTGGTLRPLQHSLVNPLATMVLSTINPDVAFVGCNGVHAVRGVTNVNLPEAEVKREMLSAARRRVIVADGSKLGEVAAVNLCPVTDVGLVITGQSAPQSVLDDLATLGVDVEVAV
jgi:DeoR family transcriptional regulator, aga operon transcriptional repressor